MMLLIPQIKSTSRIKVIAQERGIKIRILSITCPQQLHKKKCIYATSELQKKQMTTAVKRDSATAAANVECGCYCVENRFDNDSNYSLMTLIIMSITRGNAPTTIVAIYAAVSPAKILGSR